MGIKVKTIILYIMCNGIASIFLQKIFGVYKSN